VYNLIEVKLIYKVDNQVQTPFQISDTADKNMRLAEVMGPEDKRANVTYADLATQLFELIAKVVFKKLRLFFQCTESENRLCSQGVACRCHQVIFFK
jgi:hypothetical protein